MLARRAQPQTHTKHLPPPLGRPRRCPYGNDGADRRLQCDGGGRELQFEPLVEGVGRVVAAQCRGGPMVIGHLEAREEDNSCASYLGYKRRERTFVITKTRNARYTDP